MNEQVIIHEIKSVKNSQDNAEKLFNPEGTEFFWNDKGYRYIHPGDYVYIINPTRGWAIFTRLVEKQIISTHDPVLQVSHFYGNKQRYEIGDPEQRFRSFARFEIIERAQIPPRWKWDRHIRQSEQYYLWTKAISDQPKRLSRLKNIEQIFGSGEASRVLKETKRLLSPEAKSWEITYNHPYRREIAAIRTKPFLLMAGVSGTGKSQLVRTLAYKTCPEGPLRQGHIPGNFINICVKPNWHDSSELFGYVSHIPAPHYVKTEFISFIINAWKHVHVPFFACLDEMNLAPVEQYFAEYLSTIESRSKRSGKVITDPVISSEKFSIYQQELGKGVEAELCEQFLRDGICLPPNLVIIGTVNMDETTHSFSRKVLDRAMTFEKKLDREDGFSLSDLDRYDWTYEAQMNGSLFIQDQIKAFEILDGFEEKAILIDRLNQINAILKSSPFIIAYRTLEEAMMYAYFNSLFGHKPSKWLGEVLDEIVMMKILPRIEGDEEKAGKVLRSLHELLTTQDQFKELAKSRDKSALMLERLKTGYTSFWN